MKRIIPVVVLILLSAGVNAQWRVSPGSSEFSSSELSNTPPVSPVFRKQPLSISRSSFRIPGERPIKIGRTLTILGGAMLIGGISTYASSDKTPTQRSYQNSNGQWVTYDEYDPKFTLGILMMLGGTGMTVPGIIVWRKGIKKRDQYLKEQESLSFDIRGSSGALVYKF